MSRACLEFRARLAQALGARAQRVFAPELEWHTHVLTCGECRALLESEQALEHVLASLPRPTLPPDLALRVLERLAAQRVDAELDRTLDLALRERADGDLAAPEELASELLARLAPARAQADRERRLAAALDELLDRVPASRAPRGLSARVLKGLAEARRVPQAPALRAVRAPTPLESVREPHTGWGPWTWLAAAGVALVTGAAAWLLSRPRPGEAVREDLVIQVAPTPAVRRDGASSAAEPENEAGAPLPQPAEGPSALDASEPELELLAQLELLESWDLLTSEALELELLGVDENALLSLQSTEFESSAADEAAPQAPAAPSSNPKNG